jgi:6-pyruvoyltetrahydropterin/6-carboxytetrahydropterin synthase
MYYVSKRMEIAGAHNLKLDYESKCQNLHGHNWIITVYCKAKELNHNGMVEDFTLIKKKIHDKLDHKYINEVPELSGINPTAENIAKWICEQIPTCYKAEVQESEGNKAIYIEEDF